MAHKMKKRVVKAKKSTRKKTTKRTKSYGGY